MLIYYNVTDTFFEKLNLVYNLKWENNQIQWNRTIIALFANKIETGMFIQAFVIPIININGNVIKRILSAEAIPNSKFI